MVTLRASKVGGWWGGAMVLGKLPVPRRPTILITVGQGPIALAVGVGGDGLDIFTLILLFFFPLSLGDGRIYTEILSQRAVETKTTNHPTHPYLGFFFFFFFKSYCTQNSYFTNKKEGYYLAPELCHS